MCFHSVEDEELFGFEQLILSAKVSRLNLSEVYQYLNAESIFHEMVERKLITPQQKENAEFCNSKYAQNISAAVDLFEMNNPLTFLLDLCNILEATQSPDHRKLAMKFRSGMTDEYSTHSS